MVVYYNMFRRSSNNSLRRHLNHYEDVRRDVDIIQETVSNVNADMTGIVDDMNNRTRVYKQLRMIFKR